MALGHDFGEILPEDIDQFSRMKDVEVGSANEWLDAMRKVPEAAVKEAFASLLSEPTKKDWSGESDDHFSANVLVRGRRRTAAFLLKGPSDFREMTQEMCGKRADQIHRMVNSDADVSVVQHAHLIGSVVRQTLRELTFRPGDSRRKYCLDAVAPESLRSDACVELLTDASPPTGISMDSVGAGRYAVYRHCGPYDGIAEAYKRLFTLWLPGSGGEMDDRAWRSIATRPLIPLPPNC